MVRLHGEPESKDKGANLTAIDHKKNVVRSVTGQITWNHGEGICTIDAPLAQVPPDSSRRPRRSSSRT